MELRKKAFKMNDCELNGINSYKKDRLEFESKEDWMKKTNLFFSSDINIQNFIGLGLSIGRSKDENFKDGELQNQEETGIEEEGSVEEKNWKDILEFTIPSSLEYVREFCRIVS